MAGNVSDVVVGRGNMTFVAFIGFGVIELESW
jgi:hypothetical protein